jgi:hypothetical protein
LIAFVIFFNALRILARFLFLLVYWCINGLLDNFASGCSVFLELITALLSSTAFLVPSSRGFKISPWGHVGIVGFVVLKLSYKYSG